MLKAIVLSFIGLLLIIFALGPSQTKKISPFIQYSTLIESGEANILDEDFGAALKNYDQAIKLIDRPLANDCFTALQLAAFLGDKNKFRSFLRKGFSVGLNAVDLKRDSLLNSYIKQNHLDKTLSLKSDKYGKIHSKSINRFLRDTLLKMSEYDDKWKVYYLDSLSAVDPKNEKFYGDKYDSIVSNLVEDKLMPIISKYGYPGERLIGMERVGGYERQPSDYAFTDNHALFILFHYYTRPKDCKYNDLFHAEMEKGNLNTGHYAEIMDFQAALGEGKFCEVPYYNERQETDDTTQFVDINRRRSKIGLGRFELKTQKYKRGQKICREIKNGNYRHIKLFYWCG